ncbi:MAG: 3'-5' exonuclease [Clostridia bacterium]|nr:3'-5' exonuclease [Clostridia bacterium]
MVIYFDTETTGLHPGNICQLSYIVEDGLGTYGKNFFFTVDNVEYSAYLVHGFSVADLFRLSGGKRFIDSIKEISCDFASADLIVAHNVDFDLNFMRAEFKNANATFKYNKEFCSMKSSVCVCKLPRSRGVGYKYPKLTELCAFLNITEQDVMDTERRLYGSVNQSHDARYDTAALYLCVKKGGALFPNDLCVEEFI